MNRRELLIAAAATAGAGQSLLAVPAGAAAPPPGGNPADLTLAEASKAIRSGALTGTDLTLACLGRIEAGNPRINAIITPMREQALAQAAMLDREAKAGKYRSALHGVPIALKDNIDTADAPTTNASALLKDHVPAEDAHVVRRLRQAGAIIVAKANLAEFAVSPTNATSNYGPVRNPWNPDHVSGGSSGGSGAAVATGMCLGALGTDSGGSVRIPAAWCGVVGLKPTAGLVSNGGAGPGIAILDTIGPIGRTVEDVALLFDQMTGYDPRDPMSVERPRPDYATGLRQPVSALRIGVPRRLFFEQLDPEVATAVDAALKALAMIVGSVRDVAFEWGSLPEGAFTAPDLLSYHGRPFAERPDAYQPRTRNIMRMLTNLLDDPQGGSTSQKMALHAATIRSIAQRQRTIDAAFDGFEVLALPTTKTLPPTVEAAVASEYGPGTEPLFSIENTMIFNLLGLPALSVPCGLSKDGLPIGLMIVGRRFSEATLLALGAAYERRTDWRGRRPVEPGARNNMVERGERR
ncbi:aspartyl-tRNA(Asn)/glutamyl-tRNA(Gln) amidotransferase subunit A [Sphingopyxis panaciterrae]|uniref:amidase n=1 Tax=Sphingopyxis panaciterrae TaxID=363841 RepID=UPI0014209244|nr:amidase [Sphingopyxis panaciterrae]NIJ38410.1 aspartyl-tRNA(Asn)/glutamyl-tRNA(Gln) amidotransferase subunit A [Sphingopyxis panaciterrae]